MRRIRFYFCFVLWQRSGVAERALHDQLINPFLQSNLTQKVIQSLHITFRFDQSLGQCFIEKKVQLSLLILFLYQLSSISSNPINPSKVLIFDQNKKKASKVWIKGLHLIKDRRINLQLFLFFYQLLRGLQYIAKSNKKLYLNKIKLLYILNFSSTLLFIMKSSAQDVESEDIRKSESSYRFQSVDDNPQTLTLTKDFPPSHFLCNAPKYIWISETLDNDAFQQIELALQQKIKVFNNTSQAYTSLKNVNGLLIICADKQINNILNTFKQPERIIYALYYCTNAQLFQRISKQAALKEKIKGGSLNDIKLFLKNFKYKNNSTLEKFNFISANNNSWLSNPFIKILRLALFQEFNQRALFQQLKNTVSKIGFIKQTFFSEFQRDIFQDKDSKQGKLISWYMKKTFAYVLVNSIFYKPQHPSQILLIQPYVKSMFNSIIDLHLSQKYYKKSFKCFKGEVLGINQLKNIQRNIGLIVENLGFVSAVLNSSHLNSIPYNVIFQIEVYCIQEPDGKNDFGYAFLPESQQILFNILNFFKIKGIHQVQSLSNRPVMVVKLEYLPYSKITELSNSQINKAERTAKFYIDPLMNFPFFKRFDLPWRSVVLGNIWQDGKKEGIKNNILGKYIQAIDSSKKESKCFAIMHLIREYANQIRLKNRAYLHLLQSSQNFIFASTLKKMGQLYLQIQVPNKEKALWCYKQCVGMISRCIGAQNSLILQSNLAIAQIYHGMNQDSEALVYMVENEKLSAKLNGNKSPMHLGIIKKIAQLLKGLGKLDESIGYFESFMYICEENLIQNQDAILDILSQLGQIYHTQGKHQNALQKFLKCQKMKMQIKSTTNISLAKTLKNIGLIYFYLDKAQQSLQYYEKCQKILIQKQNCTNFIEDQSLVCLVAQVLSEKGQVYQYQGDYEQALECYQISQQRIRKLPNHEKIPLFLELMSKIGLVCDRMGQSEKALSYYKKCQRLNKEERRQFDQSLIQILQRIGQVYLQRSEKSKALKYFHQSEEIQQKLQNKSLKQYISTLRNIGLIYQRRQQNEISLSYYLKCWEIQKARLGEDRQLNVTLLIDIGLVYKGLCEYRKSLQFLIQGQLIQSQLGPSTNIQYLNILKNIGLIYKSLGKYSQALEYFLRCEKSYAESSSYLNKISYSSTLTQIGFIYNEQEKYNDSLTYYLRAEQIESTIIAETPFFAITLNNIAYVYDNQGLYEKALLYYNRCYEIEKKTIGQDNQKVAATLNNIGLTYKKLKRYEKALQYYHQSEIIKLKTIGQNNASYALTLNNIASVYQAIGQLQQAAKYYQQAQMIEANSIGEYNLSYAITLNNLGSLFDRLNQNNKALNYYQRSLQMKRMIGENSNSIGKTLVNIGYLYKKMGFQDKAELAYKQWKQIKKQMFGDIFMKIDYNFANLNSLIGQVQENSYDQNIEQITKKYFGYKDNLIQDIHALKQNEPRLKARKQKIDSQKYAKESLKLYQQCLQVQKKMLSDNHEEVINILFKISMVQIFLGDLISAINNNLQIESILSSLSIFRTQYVYCLFTIAYSYNKLEKYDQSMRYFLKILEVKKQLIGQENLSYVHTLKHVGWSYKNMQKPREALKYYEKSYKIEVSIYGEKSYQLLDTLIQLGKTHSNLQQYQVSTKYLFLALQRAKIKISRQSNSYALKQKRLAHFYDQEGYFMVSLKHYAQYQKHKNKPNKTKEANLRDQKQVGTELAAVYIHLSHTFTNTQNYQKALEYSMKAYEIANSFGQKNYQLLQICNEIASLYNRMNNFDKAFEFLSKSIYIDSLYGSETNLTPSIHLNLGRAYQGKEQYEDAYRQFKLSLQIFHKIFGDKNFFRVQVIYCIGVNYKLQQLYNQSLSYFKECEQIVIEENLQSNQNYKFITLYKLTILDIAEVYFKIQQYQNSLGYYEKYSQITKAVKSFETKKNEGEVKLNMAKIYDLQGETNKAMTILLNYEKSLQRSRKTLNGQFLAEFYDFIGKLHYKKKQIEKAQAYYKKSENAQNKVKLENMKNSE